MCGWLFSYAEGPVGRELAVATDEAQTQFQLQVWPYFMVESTRFFDEVHEDKAQEVISLASQGLRKTGNNLCFRFGFSKQQ